MTITYCLMTEYCYNKSLLCTIKRDGFLNLPYKNKYANQLSVEQLYSSTLLRLHRVTWTRDIQCWIMVWNQLLRWNLRALGVWYDIAILGEISI